MILKNKRTRETLEIEYSEFRKKFAKETFGKKHIKNIEGSFEFKDVCFSYDNKNQVLKNLNLKVEANKIYR